MQLFKSQSSRSRNNNDVELGASLIENHRHNIVNDRTSNASPKPFYPRSSNPRIAAPSSHLPIFPISTRRTWRISWQTVLIAVLSVYILYTWIPRAGTVVEQQRLVEYGGGPPRTDLTHLIMVAGHAIWMGGKSLGVDEAEWYGYYLWRFTGDTMEYWWYIGHYCHIRKARRRLLSNILKKEPGLLRNMKIVCLSLVGMNIIHTFFSHALSEDSKDVQEC